MGKQPLYPHVPKGTKPKRNTLHDEIILLQELMLSKDPDPNYRDGYIAACSDILWELEQREIR